MATMDRRELLKALAVLGAVGVVALPHGGAQAAGDDATLAAVVTNVIALATRIR